MRLGRKIYDKKRRKRCLWFLSVEEGKRANVIEFPNY